MIAEYGCMADYLDSLTITPIKGHTGVKRYNDANYPGAAKWYGMEPSDGPANREGISRLAMGGWPRGVDRLAKLTGSLDVPRMPSVKRRPVRGDRGDSIDMLRVYSGDLDTAWTRIARRKVIGPFRAMVVIDTLCSGGATADSAFWRNAAAIALGDILSAAGYGVKAVAVWQGKAADGKTYGAQVIIKDYNSPWDMANAAAVSIPGFFRCLGHLWVSLHSNMITDGGMHVYDFKREQLITDDAPNCFIPPSSIDCESKARAWIEQAVKSMEPVK